LVTGKQRHNFNAMLAGQFARNQLHLRLNATHALVICLRYEENVHWTMMSQRSGDPQSFAAGEKCGDRRRPSRSLAHPCITSPAATATYLDDAFQDPEKRAASIRLSSVPFL
jgi:hypothetical protein